MLSWGRSSSKSSTSTSGYQLLSTGKASHAANPNPTSNLKSSASRILGAVPLSFLFCCLAVVASFWVGRQSAGSPLSTPAIPSLNAYERVFHYNRTFGERPSSKSNQAWADLFPRYGGFFIHPDIAPQRSAFAVYHQLHCLDALRHAYWTALDHSLRGDKLVESQIPFMMSPPHMRHCIDLLRQTLMCRPDITTEVVNERLGGVTGFGTAHVCRDWDQLMGFTKKWETYHYVPAEKGGSSGHNDEHSHHHG